MTTVFIGLHKHNTKRHYALDKKKKKKKWSTEKHNEELEGERNKKTLEISVSKKERKVHERVQAQQRTQILLASSQSKLKWDVK